MNMNERPDNYKIQVKQAKKRFLTYDQQELIKRCSLRNDDSYFYVQLLSSDYRICRKSGDMERLSGDSWVDGNSFGEVMTVLDWLCDSRPDRFVTGRWINLVSHGHYFHGNLQEGLKKEDAQRIDRDPQGFERACRALKGEKMSGGDIGYAIELIDGLRIYVQLWHGDEEFPPRVCFLWDENALRYIRYETSWFAIGLLIERIIENMV